MQQKKLPRSEFVKIARAVVKDWDFFQEGTTQIIVDEENQEWGVLLKEVKEHDPESGGVYHEILGDKNYQAVHVFPDPPEIGGGVWILVEEVSGEVLLCVSGL